MYTCIVCTTLKWNWSKVLNRKSKDIIGQDKTQLLYDTFMRQQSSGIYNVCLSKNTNKVDIEHKNTRQIKYLNKYFLFFTFANKNFLKCLHLLISSVFLFRRSLLWRNLIIHTFSVIYNGQIIELGFPLTLEAIEYLMEKSMLLRFNCQMYLANFVQFSYFSCLGPM